MSKKQSPKAFFTFFSLRNHNEWAWAACVLRANDQLWSNFKPYQNHHIRGQLKTDAFCRYTPHLHGQRGMQQCGYAGSMLIIAGGKLQSLHQSGGEIFCWALQAGQPCTPPYAEGGGGRGVGQTRPGWSFSPLMGWGEVCRHVTKHTVCMISYPWGKSRAQPCWTTDILTQCCLETGLVAQSRHSADKHR